MATQLSTESSAAIIQMLVAAWGPVSEVWSYTGTRTVMGFLQHGMESGARTSHQLSNRVWLWSQLWRKGSWHLSGVTVSRSCETLCIFTVISGITAYHLGCKHSGIALSDNGGTSSQIPGPDMSLDPPPSHIIGKQGCMVGDDYSLPFIGLPKDMIY